MSKIQIKILDDRIKLPQRATPGAAGYDLQAVRIDGLPLEETIFIAPGEQVLISAGIACHIQDTNIAMQILPRSKNGKKGLVLGNLIGLLDSDYQGEVFILAWNRSTTDTIVIQPLQQIAQMIFVPVIHPEFEAVDEFETESLRGDGGISKDTDTIA